MKILIRLSFVSLSCHGPESSAGDLLDKMGAKAGDPKARADATVSQAGWDETAGLGRGTVEVMGQTWQYLDYQDSLPLDQELAARLGVHDGEPELRQCLVLHLAAALRERAACLSHAACRPSIHPRIYRPSTT